MPASADVGAVRINEVESSGGTPGDWVELINTGTTAVDVSGLKFLDNDSTHTKYSIPAGTTIPAGGYLVLEEAQFGFGLGGGDSAQLFAPDGVTIIDSYSWTAHAATTYGRCPNGTGAFITTGISTKGAANNCGAAVPTTVKLNEVESSGGAPGDWVELVNTGASSVDLSGLRFLDNDATHTAYVIPAGTSIPAGGYLILEEAQFIFGLGSADSAQLFAADGTTLIDSYSWTAHAATTYGRCPNGTGAFVTTTASTKGTANACPGDVAVSPWPGDAAVSVADGAGVLGGNMSGLTYEASGSAAPGVLWAVKNGPGTLYRLVWNGTIWTPDPGWSAAGRALRYPDGTGDPDAEGVTFAAAGSAGGLYVSTERNNANNSVSRLSVLLFDPSAPGTTLTAMREWNLTADLPVAGPNLGFEAITWIPDQFLVSRGFFDESKNRAYNPADYPDHGSGLFFVGVEASGIVYAYALNHTGSSFTRVATIQSGFTGVMALEFDRELNNFWVVCDDTCSGRSALLAVNAQGRFVVTSVFERPAAMPNLNNEGFAIAAQAECVTNRKPAYWADDGATGGNAIRRGTVPCNGGGGSERLTVRFDDRAGQNAQFGGEYPAGWVNWGEDSWWHAAPYGLLRTKSLSFNGNKRPPITSAALSFVRPTRLISLLAFNGGGVGTTVTLRCDGPAGQPEKTVLVAAGQQTTIETGWTALCTGVTLGSTNGWDTNFDDLELERPVLAGSAQLITFNDRAGQNQALNGQYPAGAINWGTGTWWLAAPYGAFSTRSISFNGAGLTSGSFSFVTPGRLVSLQAYNGGNTSSTLTLRCTTSGPAQPEKVTTLTAGQVLTIQTGWSGACTSVTITSTNGWDTNFDNLLVEGG